MDFAVRVKGLDEPDGETCRWVLAVDGNQFLTAGNDGKLEWHKLADCSFVKATNPEAPIAVIPIQPANQLVTPHSAVRRLNGGS